MHRTRITLLTSLVLVSMAASATRAPAAVVAPPNTSVEGRTQSEWSAEWWKSVFAIPVYAADGTTIIHPQFDAGLAPGDTVYPSPLIALAMTIDGIANVTSLLLAGGAIPVPMNANQQPTLGAHTIA